MGGSGELINDCILKLNGLVRISFAGIFSTTHSLAFPLRRAIAMYKYSQ